jgi:predicted XRE-type DNA-binding protein
MSDERKFTQSSSDVFTDRRLNNPNEVLIKANIMAEIAYLFEENGWTQTKAAEQLGVPQPEIFKIMRGKFSRFPYNGCSNY